MAFKGISTDGKNVLLADSGERNLTQVPINTLRSAFLSGFEIYRR